MRIAEGPGGGDSGKWSLGRRLSGMRGHHRSLFPRALGCLWRVPAGLFYGVFWCVMPLSHSAQVRVGRGLGHALRWLFPYLRGSVRADLARCFPELPVAEREQLLRKHFESLGIGLLELALFAWASDARLHRLARVEGLEHLQAALSRGRGVILLTGHFTHGLLGTRILGMHCPIRIMYSGFGRRLGGIVTHYVEKYFNQSIPRNRPRELLRCLRRNGAVSYAPDYDFGPRKSVFVPFFGVPASTVTATSRIARLSGAAVVPWFTRRVDDGCVPYRIVVSPALAQFPGPDAVQDTLRINRLLEDEIRKMPEQYLWAQRRFRTPPPETAAGKDPG
jgi:KDO2-lipid IV(A) lauroyltransferase